MIYAGCSGYSFKEWVGHFYPPKTKSKDYLEHYATKLNSVEINHTFRRFARIEVIEEWAEKTPEHFRFSFKMHQSLTHRARLKDIGPAFFQAQPRPTRQLSRRAPAGFLLRDGISTCVLERARGRRKIENLGGRALRLRARDRRCRDRADRAVYLSASEKTASIYGCGDLDLALARAGIGRRCGRHILLCETRRCGCRSGTGGAHRCNLKAGCELDFRRELLSKKVQPKEGPCILNNP